jgi:hypothetical protein
MMWNLTGLYLAVGRALSGKDAGRSRRRFFIASLAVAIVFNCVAPVVRASEQDAILISQNIQRIHIPHGTLIDPLFKSANPLSADYTVIERYTRGGDSALWTGHYLAAEAFRYRVTGSAEALANVRKALGGIKSLVDVTGTDLLARCLVPVDWEINVDKGGIINEEAHHGIHVSNIGGQSYYWVGNTSRDQYSGVFFGLAVAYDMVNDANGQDVRVAVGQIVTRLLDFLLKNNWAVVMPNGTISTVFVGRYEQQLSFLQVGRHVNPSRFESRYQTFRTLFGNLVGTAIFFDSLDNHNSYFKFNLDYINLYNLIRLEESGSRYRDEYLDAYNTLRNKTHDHGNVHFNLIDLAVKGINVTRDGETRAFLFSDRGVRGITVAGAAKTPRALLDEWLTRPRRDTWLDWRGTYQACGDDRACAPIPVKDQVRTDFLWQRSPYLLWGGGYGLIETAGIDYILPYWMGRYYGVL